MKTCKDGTPDYRGENRCDVCHKFKKWEDLCYDQHWFMSYDGPDFTEYYVCNQCITERGNNWGECL